MLSLQVKGEFFLQVSYYTLVMFLYLYDKKMELEHLFLYSSLSFLLENRKGNY